MHGLALNFNFFLLQIKKNACVLKCLHFWSFKYFVDDILFWKSFHFSILHVNYIPLCGYTMYVQGLEYYIQFIKTALSMTVYRFIACDVKYFDNFLLFHII